MGYPKWIEAHGGVLVCVQNEADEEAFTNPPNKPPEETTDMPDAPVEADEPSEPHAPAKKGAKKKS